jgi:hypothetical protein
MTAKLTIAMALLYLLLTESTVHAAMPFEGTWCRENDTEQYSWVLSISQGPPTWEPGKGGFAFSEAGVCEIVSQKKSSKWTEFGCRVLHEGFVGRATLQVYLDGPDRLIFNSKDPEQYEWVPRVLVRCTAGNDNS